MQNLADLLETSKNNKEVSKKQIAEIRKKLLSKKKEIEEIESRIAYLKARKRSEKDDPEYVEETVKLLHKEPCCDF